MPGVRRPEGPQSREAARSLDQVRLPLPVEPDQELAAPLKAQRRQGHVAEMRQGDFSEDHRAQGAGKRTLKTSNNSVAGKSAALFDWGMSFEKSLARTVSTLQSLVEIKPSIEAAAELIVGTLRKGGKLLICGNGGSCAEASHFATELLGRFDANRRSLPAVALSSDGALITCIGNDLRLRTRSSPGRLRAWRSPETSWS